MKDRFEKILEIGICVSLLLLVLTIPFAIRDCTKRNEEDRRNEAACLGKGGTWLRLERACVASPK